MSITKREVKDFRSKKEVCIQCGKYFIKDKLRMRFDDLLGKIYFCENCTSKT